MEPINLTDIKNLISLYKQASAPPPEQQQQPAPPPPPNQQPESAPPPSVSGGMTVPAKGSSPAMSKKYTSSNATADMDKVWNSLNRFSTQFEQYRMNTKMASMKKQARRRRTGGPRNTTTPTMNPGTATPGTATPGSSTAKKVAIGATAGIGGLGLAGAGANYAVNKATDIKNQFITDVNDVATNAGAKAADGALQQVYNKTGMSPEQVKEMTDKLNAMYGKFNSMYGDVRDMYHTAKGFLGKDSLGFGLPNWATGLIGLPLLYGGYKLVSNMFDGDSRPARGRARRSRSNVNDMQDYLYGR